MAIERPSERTGECLHNLLEWSIEHQQRGVSFYIDIIYLLTFFFFFESLFIVWWGEALCWTVRT